MAANAYADNARWVKAPSIAAMRARSRQCFDYNFYMHSNAHLLHLDNPSPADLWEHFVRVGQFELGAAHRCAATVICSLSGVELCPCVGRDKRSFEKALSCGSDMEVLQVDMQQRRQRQAASLVGLGFS